MSPVAACRPVTMRANCAVRLQGRPEAPYLAADVTSPVRKDALARRASDEQGPPGIGGTGRSDRLTVAG